MAFEELTRVIDSMPTWDIPAADVLLYYKRKPIYRHMTGFADREAGIPVTEDTLYNLYSASKVATCTAALTLFDKGLYCLDDPVYEYIPEFRDITVKDEKTGEIRKAENTLTIRHLFTMSGGLDYDLAAPNILEVKKEKGENASTLDIVKSFPKKPLGFEPGTHYRYSLCHDVLGALIEVWSGMSFGEYLKKAVLEPVGMTRTGFERNDAIYEKMAYQYCGFDHRDGSYKDKHKNCVYRLSERYESGGAGLYSCVEDYAKFVDMLCNGGVALSGEQVIKKETIDLMRKDQLDDVRRADFTRDIAVGKIGYSYGLGVRTMIKPEMSPSAFGEFGWDGAMGAYMFIDPANEFALFYAQHESGAAWHHVEIRDAAYRGLREWAK